MLGVSLGFQCLRGFSDYSLGLRPSALVAWRCDCGNCGRSSTHLCGAGCASKNLCARPRVVLRRSRGLYSQRWPPLCGFGSGERLVFPCPCELPLFGSASSFSNGLNVLSISLYNCHSLFSDSLFRYAVAPGVVFICAFAGTNASPMGPICRRDFAAPDRDTACSRNLWRPLPLYAPTVFVSILCFVFSWSSPF